MIYMNVEYGCGQINIERIMTLQYSCGSLLDKYLQNYVTKYWVFSFLYRARK